MDFNAQYQQWLQAYGAGSDFFFAGTQRLAMPQLPDGEIPRVWANDVPFLGIITGGGSLFKATTARIVPRTNRMREHMKKKNWFEFFVKTPVNNSSLLVWRNFIGKSDANSARLLKDMAETTVRLNGHAASDSKQRFMSQLYLLDSQINRWNSTRAQTVPVHSEAGGVTGWDILKDSVLDAPQVFGDAAGQIGGGAGNIIGEALGSAASGFTNRLNFTGFLFVGVMAVTAYVFIVQK